jgi:hypothetical protein
LLLAQKKGVEEEEIKEGKKAKTIKITFRIKIQQNTL